MIKNKYKAKKAVVDGIVFDSRKEAKRYTELKKLEEMGSIRDLSLQVQTLAESGISSSLSFSTSFFF